MFRPYITFPEKYIFRTEFNTMFIAEVTLTRVNMFIQCGCLDEIIVEVPIINKETPISKILMKIHDLINGISFVSIIEKHKLF